MQSRKLSGALAVIAIAVTVVLFIVLQDEDDDSDSQVPVTTTTAPVGEKPSNGTPAPEPEVATIVVRDGKPAGGVAELEFAKGERIRFVVESDVAEEVHLHGYDIAKEVKGGGRVDFDVPATIEGVFEVELEHSAVPLAEISVTPG